MGWLIAALGTGLAIGGTIGIYFGAPYIQVEWGYSEVIAGTTALSAGILAVALAAILFVLRDLKRLATAASGGLAARPSAPPRPHPATRPDPSLTAPAVIADGLSDANQGPRVVPSRGDDPALFPSVSDAEPASGQAPTVVGRYEANGASYVLFSDGSIEVETETGTQRYASMQELRADIARQEAG